MNTTISPPPTDTATDTTARQPPALRTRKQIQAAAMAEQAATLARWKRALPRARQTWSRIDPIDLAAVNGNVHRLAGLVQLRYHLSREQADQQAVEFLAVSSSTDVSRAERAPTRPSDPAVQPPASLS